MTGYSIGLVILALIHCVVAFLASLTVLSLPRAYLRYRNIYAFLSFGIPFFGLLIIYKNSQLLPPIRTAMSKMATEPKNKSGGAVEGAGYDGYEMSSMNSSGDGGGGGD